MGLLCTSCLLPLRRIISSDSGLIYFAQNGNYLGPVSGTSPDPVTGKVGFNENGTLPFQAGKTYRLRIVNTSAFSAFFFWIDGHDMRIIEVDGVRASHSCFTASLVILTCILHLQTDVQESPIDLISITVAQRYSVLVTARNDSTPQNWAIHANMDTDMFDTVPDALNPSMCIFGSLTRTLIYHTP